MIHGRLDPNERFRTRRQQARRRRAVRRLSLVGLVVLTAAGLTVGARWLGGDTPTVTAPAAQPEAAQTPAATAPAAPEPRARPAEIRGVHVTMALASLPGKLDEYLSLTSDGLNTLQLDVKDENGEVGFRSPKVPLAHKIGAARPYYKARQVAQRVRKHGIYLVGRVVVFEDPVLSRNRPQMAIRTADGGVWTNDVGLGWTNPYDRRVWQYNVDLAVAAIEAGFDEIMFDYVRFPTDGDLASAVFNGAQKVPKHETIADFLDYAASRIRPAGGRLSIAVFGLSATRNLGIGQKVRRLAKEVDAVYPMVYPSHYGPGELGVPDPNGDPGMTVARSLRDFQKQLEGRKAVLVPWLQDFSMGRTYTIDEVRAQVNAARRMNAGGFLLWNASGVYTPGALAGQ
jgi:hypothetical protein